MKSLITNPVKNKNETLVINTSTLQLYRVSDRYNVVSYILTKKNIKELKESRPDHTFHPLYYEII